VVNAATAQGSITDVVAKIERILGNKPEAEQDLR
jgi:hypothetical protein